MKAPKEYLQSIDIERALANTPQVTFEITDACNLNCTYCGYGKFYSDYDERENKRLPAEKAEMLLEYLCRLWQSPLNQSARAIVYISFYGGEPLLNMPFIKRIVDYLEDKVVCTTRIFRFAMTTNALLLHKNMDYLVAHNFNVLVSLDGNRENTSYRIDKRGNEAFEKVIRNVDSLREKYPAFFEKNVSFNSVLHNRNSVESIYNFFKEKYDKIPSIGELNSSGIRPEMQQEFMLAYCNSSESLHQAEHYQKIERDMFLKSGTYQSVSTFLLQYSDFVYKDYNELLLGKDYYAKKSIPTGTCIPFGKKVFVTVNGKILPCERIGHQFALGIIDQNGINLDFAAIAKRYNQYFAKLDNHCKGCYNKRTCVQCIFNLPDIDKVKVVCEGFMNKQEFEDYKDTQLSFLAQNPEAYQKIMTEVVTKM